jgi:8-oxo-dGTP pyrophosphatase MutT (NUDIX family)
MKVVYTGETPPETFTKSIFLAGPTPRNKEEQESWRPDALKILEDKGYDGVVFVPEDRKGEFKLEYDDQVGWEETYLNMADCILFWVPRDLSPDSKGYPKMAAFTTNVEFGAWATSGKLVFGAPPKATKNGYLKHYCEKYNIPVGDTLTETLESAMEKVGEGAERSEGEREVPLYIWNTDSFQSWYKAQKGAGNRLDHARVQYNFRPRYKDFVWMWVLKVDMYVASEDRNKSNELVITRTDISSVLLYSDVESPQGDGLVDYEVVLIKEYRSPASTKDGFIRELPGGSSPKSDEDPLDVAASEVQEETGFYLDPKRLKDHGPRQLAGTFSAHKCHLYSAYLTREEMDWFKSQDGIVHGNVEDSERTFIEVHNVYDLVHEQGVDWSTLGMIISVLAQ